MKQYNELTKISAELNEAVALLEAPLQKTHELTAKLAEALDNAASRSQDPNFRRTVAENILKSAGSGEDLFKSLGNFTKDNRYGLGGAAAGAGMGGLTGYLLAKKLGINPAAASLLAAAMGGGAGGVFGNQLDTLPTDDGNSSIMGRLARYAQGVKPIKEKMPSDADLPKGSDPAGRDPYGEEYNPVREAARQAMEEAEQARLATSNAAGEEPMRFSDGGENFAMRQARKDVQ